MSRVAAGVDVGGTRLRVCIQDTLTGARSSGIDYPVPRDAAALIASIVDIVKTEAAGREISAVGVGLPGQVKDGRSVWVPNLPFLDGVDIAEMIGNGLDARCDVVNDAQATLLAESREGAAVGYSSAVLFAVGTGIGGAYLIDGRIVRGANGCAGAFGWLTMTGGAVVSGHGEWEQLASGRSLERLAKEWGGVSPLLEAARNGDGRARDLLGDYGAILGHGIGAIASMLDPELVIFAGGLSEAFGLLEVSMREGIRRCASPAAQGTELVPATLGSRAGVIGALHLAMGDHVEPYLTQGESDDH